MAGLVQLLETAPTGFTSAQITEITNALQTAITNVLNMFVSLLPVMAIIAGVAFGIKIVRGLFKKVGKGRA